ncbi:MAG: hypothetical protein GF320_18380 [Armatimonadia bacterium]|nr:hypothetical protein [Armatimonadia bacterium]
MSQAPPAGPQWRRLLMAGAALGILLALVLCCSVVAYVGGNLTGDTFYLPHRAFHIRMAEACAVDPRDLRAHKERLGSGTLLTPGTTRHESHVTATVGEPDLVVDDASFLADEMALPGNTSRVRVYREGAALAYVLTDGAGVVTGLLVYDVAHFE